MCLLVEPYNYYKFVVEKEIVFYVEVKETLIIYFHVPRSINLVKLDLEIFQITLQSWQII